MMPHKSSVSMPWRMKKGRYNFIGSECVECKLVLFPSRTDCPRCHKEMEDRRMSGDGIVATFTENHVAPAGFEKYIPYTVAIIQLEEGPMVSGQVVGDTRNIKIGTHVRAVFRKLYEDGP